MRLGELSARCSAVCKATAQAPAVLTEGTSDDTQDNIQLWPPQQNMWVAQAAETAKEAATPQLVG